tara:strand:+ start:51578 stop:51943 length:366 start_codon:yes stop_codon:yes gene_type:complete
MKLIFTMVFLGIAFSACSSTRPPTQQLTQTEASISQAEQVGAEEYAPLEIREARKKLQEARSLVKKEKYEDAKLLADRAMVDAEYAQIKTLSAKAQKAVYQLQESIKALQKEIGNKIQQRK